MTEKTDPSTDRLGTIERDGDTVVLTYERDLAHPPATVWRALTESEHLRAWFPSDIIGDRAAGASLTFRFWPESVEQAGEEIEASGLDLDDPVDTGTLITWDPTSVFEFSWGDEQVRFDLTPTESGTRLNVRVQVFQVGHAGVAGTAAGYHVCLAALREYVDGATPDIFEKGRVQALEARYAELV